MKVSINCTEEFMKKFNIKNQSELEPYLWTMKNTRKEVNRRYREKKRQELEKLKAIAKKIEMPSEQNSV